jgi:hypothetical protein
MWRTALFILAMMICYTLIVLAQVPMGVLTGHVPDTAGKPVIGATVRIVGTSQGGVSKAPDGKFMVHKIRIGEYRVRVSAVGYKPVEYEVRIEADQTTSISTHFAERINLTDGCPSVGVPMVRRERFGTTSIITAEELDRMP